MNKIFIVSSIASVILIIIAIVFFGDFIYEQTRSDLYKFSSTSIIMMMPTKTNYYAIAFQTCSGKDELPEPTIFISSDSEERAIRLIKNIKPDTCYVTSALIKAENPNTISFTIVPTEKYFKLESIEDKKYQELKAKIQEKNQELVQLLKIPDSPDFDQKFAQIAEDIKQLRIDLGRVKSTLK